MRALLLGLTLTFLSAPAALAQGVFGIGGQGGDPTGITVKLGSGPGSFDAAAGLDFSTERRFFVQAHYLLDDSPIAIEDIPLRFYYGLGAFVGGNDTDEVFGGVSSNFGLSYFPLPRFEVFGQLTPRLRLAPGTDADLAPALGIRFYP